MEALIKNILEVTLMSSIMILLVMSIKAIWQTKINFKIISVLWILVLVRLILPVTFESPYHIDSLFPERETIVAAETPAVTETNAGNELDAGSQYSPIYGDNNVDYQMDSNTENMVINAPDEPSFIESTIKSLKQISIWMYLFIIWIAGLSIIVFKNLYSVSAFSQRVVNCEVIHDRNLTRLVYANRKRIGLNRDVQLIRCKYVGMPITFGWIKPKILLPIRFEEKIEKDKLELVLLHELYHIKRNDILKNYLWLLAKSIHWFNPLVWIAYREYVDDIEIAVDNAIVMNSNQHIAHEYSQSIIDVLRISNRMCNVPLALSFCKDKDKLRKRVENMIKPKKKLLSAGVLSVILSIIMIVACFTTACQPTPVNLTARNNNSVAASTATTEVVEETNEPLDTIEEPIEITSDSYVSKRVMSTVSNSNGNITVDFDADIVLPNEDSIPIASVERGYFTQEQVDNIINAYFGNVTLYNPNYETKGDLERVIKTIELEATDLDLDLAQSNGIDNLEDLQTLADERITMYEGRKENAPQYKPVIEQFDISSNDHIVAAVDTTGGNREFSSFNDFEDGGGFVFYTSGDIFERMVLLNFGGPAFSSRRYLEPYSSSILDINQINDYDFPTAMKNAQDLIEAMGIEGFRLSCVCLSEDETHIIYDGDGDDPMGITDSGRQYYVFCFERLVNGISLDNSFFDGTHTENASNEDPMPYEVLQVWTEGSDIVQFNWENPISITEIQDDNTEISVDVTQAMDYMVQQAFTKYADSSYAYAQSIEIDVNEINLALARVKDTDTGKYLTIPVWDFYGDVMVEYPGGASSEGAIPNALYSGKGDFYVINDTMNSIFTINSLDGSVIDRELGY